MVIKNIPVDEKGEVDRLIFEQILKSVIDSQNINHAENKI